MNGACPRGVTVVVCWQGGRVVLMEGWVTLEPNGDDKLARQDRREAKKAKKKRMAEEAKLAVTKRRAKKGSTGATRCHRHSKDLVYCFGFPSHPCHCFPPLLLRVTMKGRRLRQASQRLQGLPGFKAQMDVLPREQERQSKRVFRWRTR